MTEVLVLSEAEVEEVLEISLLRTALEATFIAISRSAVDVPDRITVASPEGLLLAMPGYVPAAGIATKLVTLFPSNDGLGIPTHQGIVTLFDPTTGTPVAIMGAERLTQLRTAVSAAIAADLMASPTATVLTIIGAGAQARGHVEAFRSIRPWEEIRFWNRTNARAESLADGIANARASNDIEEALEDADVVAMCTHTEDPLFEIAALKPDSHVSSVGIGRELPDGLVERSLVALELRTFASIPPPAGAVDLRGREPKELVELGELIAGSAEVDRSAHRSTVYKSVGHAAEDCAAARLASDTARERDVGRFVTL